MSRPTSPSSDGGVEGLLSAIDRGGIMDWERIGRSVRADPWGPVAQDLTEAIDAAEDTGVAAALRVVLKRARATADADDRAQVAERVRTLVSRSGLSRTEFASRIGTSASRLSTYANGRVIPSAILMLRMERVARRP